MQVKELEAAVLELLDTYDDCTHFSEAIQTIGGNYQPSEQAISFTPFLFMLPYYLNELENLMFWSRYCDFWFNDMQLTDFNKLLEDEIAKSKAVSPSVPQNNPFYRQFKEAIWVRFLIHGSDFC